MFPGEDPIDFLMLSTYIVMFKKIGIIGSISFLIFFGSSVLRHNLYHSNAWDLGIFDQSIYLISIGKAPICSFLDFHILGDHAAFILYPLALLFKVYPSVYWLFFIQSLALSSSIIPIFYLAKSKKLSEQNILIVILTYLLYPLIFNVNLFDFHPDVIALPALFIAILAAQLDRLVIFLLAIAIILSCKAVFSLYLIGLGIWLLFFLKKKWIGFETIVIGIFWFIITTQIIIPQFGGHGAEISRHLNRYSYLGNSFNEILSNLILQPSILLKGIFSPANFEYIVLLLLPIIWAISIPQLHPLIAATPILGVNLLSDSLTQKNLVHQYSLLIIPCLILIVINSLSNDTNWVKNKKIVVTWICLGFLTLAKFGYFGSLYLSTLDTKQATDRAIGMIPKQVNVLTNSAIAPHLTHRQIIELPETADTNLDRFNYVLLNSRYPGFASSDSIMEDLITQLKKETNWQLKYQQDDVYLFEKN